MTEPEQVSKGVRTIVARHAKVDAVTLREDATLKSLGLSSLSAIEVLFDIEEEFDIDFPEQPGALDSGTLADLSAAVALAVAAKADPSARKT